jgi:hypothetical protein
MAAVAESINEITQEDLAVNKQNKLQNIKAIGVVVSFLMFWATAAYADEVVYAPTSAPFHTKFQEWSAQ